MTMYVQAGRVRLVDLVAAEWIKIRAQRSTYALVGFGLVFAVVAAWIEGGRVRVAPGAAGFFNPLIYPYDQLVWGLITVLAAGFGALALSGEYASGLMRATFAAVPGRRRVVLAKSLVVSLVMAAFGMTASIAALYTAGDALTGQLSGLSLGRPEVLRAAALSAALPVLGGQIGLALGALVRHPLASVGASWALLLVLPTMLASGTVGLGAATDAMPISAWTTLAHTASSGAGQSPLPSTGAAWVLLIAWPLAGLAVAATAVARRDV